MVSGEKGEVTRDAGLSLIALGRAKIGALACSACGHAHLEPTPAGLEAYRIDSFIRSAPLF